MHQNLDVMGENSGLIIRADQRSMIGQKLIMIGQHSIHSIILKGSTPIYLTKMIITDQSDRDRNFVIISPDHNTAKSPTANFGLKMKV